MQSSSAGRCAAGCIIALALASDATAQGALVGSVTSQAGERLSYAIVNIEGHDRALFTDEAGRFDFRLLPPGALAVHIRRLGYQPHDTTVEVRAGKVDTLSVELTRVAVPLSKLDVRAYPPCVEPGPPTVSGDSVLYAVLEQVRLNAEQYRFLVKQYPFEVRMKSKRENLMRTGKTQVLDRKTINYSSSGLPYRPGRIISGFGPAYFFDIPTLAEVADHDFLTLHCWHWVGATDLDSAAVLRMDFVAYDSLPGPDVNGTFLLDAASFQIRRMVLRLSKKFDPKPEMVDMEVTTDFQEILPSVPVISHVLSVQTMDSDPKIKVAETREEHVMDSLKWKKSKPGGASKKP